MSGEKYAVFSSDVKEIYSFYVPIDALAWREIGYRSLILLVGNRKLWESYPRTALVLRSIPSDARVEFVRQVPGQDVPMTARVCRLYAAALAALRDEDYLLASDADMVPISKAYFTSQDHSLDVHIFSSNAYGPITEDHIPVKFPMCFIAGKVGAWREIMRIREASIDESLKRHFAPFGTAKISFDNDELSFKKFLMESSLLKGETRKEREWFVKGRTQLMLRERTKVGGHMYRRLEYGEWKLLHLRHHIDCHFGNHKGPKNSGSILDIFRAYFPESLPLTNGYIEEYLKLESQ